MDEFEFDGFDVPGTTPVPDVVFDKLLSKLTGNELKVLLYIIRRTYGFGKNADAISLSQFREGIKTRDENGDEKVLDEGCGIGHNRTILVALASLEQKGCVTSKKRNTNAGDSDTTIYRLRFKSATKKASKAQSDNGVVTSGNHVVTPRNEGSYSTSPRWLPQVTTVVTSGNTQETVLQYTDKQETVLQGDTYGASIDSAALTQLQNENASLKARLEQVLSEIKNARNPGGNDTPSDTPFTPAGENNQLPAARETITTDHNAIPEPPCSATDGLTQETATTTHSENATPEIAPQTQEMPSSTQAVESSSNQASKQGANNDCSLSAQHHGDVVDSSSGDLPVVEEAKQQVQPIEQASDNSYSPPMATNNQPAENPPATKKSRGGKSSSKKATEINEVMQKRVEKVYEYFDKLKQEVMQKPDAHYRRTGTDTEAIIAWLDSHPTEEILREVYLRLWNTPVDKRTNFSWKKNMWIHSVLKQYETMEMDIVDERNRQAKRNVVTPGVKSTFVPPVEEEDEMAFVLPSQLRKRG